jgi:2,3-bisphosphoglycerate-independent phosphoglycerate mutase
MSFKKLSSLLAPNDSKIVLLVMDGLGGMPMQMGGLTELETAKTPNMDRLAVESVLGQHNPISLGITPGSGPAHMGLFGIDPVENEVGRGVLEAFGSGMYVKDGDVAARGNFCTVDSDGIITDRRAGRISSEEAIPLIEKLQTIKLPGVSIDVTHVKEYRFAVMMRGVGLSPQLGETDPQRTGMAPLNVIAREPAADKAAGLFNQWVAEAHHLLADEPKANALTLRGFSTDPGLPSYEDMYKLRAACIAVYPMYRGVSKLVGMDIIEFSGDSPEDEFSALEKVWDDFDFFFVHIKKTDSYGEDGNFDGKVKIIEGVDKALPELLRLKPDVLVITGDHSTPCKLKSHSWHPVPFLLWAPLTVRQDDQAVFGETACAHGGLGTFSVLDTMPLALGHALRMNKFGA